MGYSSMTFTDGDAQMPVKVEATGMTQAKLEALADAIKTQSNAVYSGVSVFFANAAPGTPTAAVHQSVKDKALCTFRSSDGRIVKLTVPAPKAAIFDKQTGVRNVLGTIGDTLATALSTATGKTLTFMKGRFVNKPGKA